ncbi:N-acetylneuraminate synthase [Methylobacter tundripaludum]|uniref:N-acetylneuraminate synthase n=1 Tax=Methylobacter tundripaludum (strain ATCC BAA-1195 / DSM 17260 / SV96) TaxID=697282 RepID=G3ISY9_METTV|nr:N-acetylneuraminate synthase [Methylobacter tundripaludum]EGW22463.1 N-acetylneuraminate synthase [Methylobacter tundripaludum SV96]
MSTFIIAEAGVNHNGNLETARQLIDAAVAAGADAVKFQTFKAENLVTQHAGKAAYQKITTDADENQLTMLKRLELKYELHFQLLAYCQKLGIEFLSTAFDFESLDFLVRKLGVETLKVPSGEITNGPFLLAHAQTGKPIILSTGMATLGEVETALGVLAFGYLAIAGDIGSVGSLQQRQPSSSAFQQAYSSAQGQAVLREKVTLLHCTSEYPTPMENINLKAMDVLQQAFGLRVGYSDHSVGLVVPVAAVARGATVIEKHFTLDRTQQGPDHKVSLEPDELKAMVQGIRDVEKALGQGLKGPQPMELENQKVVRKSLVARCPISSGECFTETNLTIKRPGTGKSPMDYWVLLGESSNRNYDADELI